jgi:uncharacterized protein involved in type VI secretion and phage assembly
MPGKADTEVLFEWIDSIRQQGLESTLQLFYGIYRGTVVSNEDPEERGRVQIRVDDLAHTSSSEVWVPPMFDMAGNKKGSFFPPEEGDWVRVVFHMGDPSIPFAYMGGWFGNTDKAPEFAYSNGRPEKRGFITRMGQSLLFSDEPGNEFVRLLWHKPAASDPALNDPSRTADRTTGNFSFLELTKDGSVQIANKNGSLMLMDATQKNVSVISQQGHALTLSDDGITIVDKDGNLISINGGKVNVVASGSVTVSGSTVNLSSAGVYLGNPASASAVCGEALMTWLTSHTHSTGVGPSGPPIIAPPPTILSKSVKLKP